MYYIYRFMGRRKQLIIYKLHNPQGFKNISLAREQIEEECKSQQTLTSTSFVVFHQEDEPAPELEMHVKYVR